VQYTITPWTVNNGNNQCPGTPITVDIWVEPTVTITAPNDTICDNGITNILPVSSNTVTGSIRYTWTVTSNPNITGETGSSGNGNALGTSIIQSLDNTSSIKQLVRYTITPWTVNNGNNQCSGTPITVDIWVEPTVTITAPNDTICDGGTTNIMPASSNIVTGSIRYTWTVTPNPNVTGENSSSGNGNNLGTSIIQTLNNTSNSKQLVQYVITPWTVNNGNNQCAGTNITVNIWVEPTTIILSTPQNDTICNRTKTNISFTSPSVTTNGFEIKVQVIPNATVFGYPTVPININPSDIISDSLINISDHYQVITYIFTPYSLDLNGNQKCPGIPDTVRYWIEPTAKIVPLPRVDTICNTEFIHVTFTTPTIATVGIGFSITAIPTNPGALSGYSNIAFFRTDSILSQKLTNNTNSKQRIIYEIRPFTLNALGNPMCNGNMEVVTIWVEPTAKVDAISSRDTLCNSESTIIRLTSVTSPTRWVEFNLEVRPEFPDSVAGYSNLNRLLTTSEIRQQLHNLSDTAQRIRFIFTPYLVNAKGNQDCGGINDTVTIWLEPELKVIISPQLDTICDKTNTSFVIHSPSKPTRPVRFRYTVVPQNPAALTGYHTTQQTGYLTGGIIAEYFSNLTDNAQFANIRVIPYSVDLNGNERCSGAVDEVGLWVEPTPKVILTPVIDTICTGLVTHMVISSVSVTKHPLRFKYGTVHSSDIEITHGQDTFNLQRNQSIDDILVNRSDLAQRVEFQIYPYLIGPGNTEICSGITGNASVWVSSELIVIADSIRKFKARTPELVKNISCHGVNDGFIHLMPVGGITSFSGYDVYDLTYSWNNMTYTTKDIDNIGAGTYRVIVRDKLMCEAADTFVITQPDPLNAQINAFQQVSCNGSDGIYFVEVTGGTEGHSTNWTFPLTIPEPARKKDTLFNIPIGFYIVEITDTNNCFKRTFANIVNPPQNDVQLITLTNYNNNEFHIRCKGENNGRLNIQNNSLKRIEYKFQVREVFIGKLPMIMLTI
ncbi:MAG: hypothetical protein HC906_14090, partial [Bacteroidales bacterium]|nr:hypothetical protein [Bacteroidales bacterium]